LLLAAKKIARDHGVAESGYRIAINTNEDAGQSVFHLHLHLLGGMNLGPMVPQTYKAPDAPSPKRLKLVSGGLCAPRAASELRCSGEAKSR